MPRPPRIALVQETDDELAGMLADLAGAPRLSRHRDLILDFRAIVAEAPSAVLVRMTVPAALDAPQGPPHHEQIGALQALAESLPDTRLVLVTSRESELSVAAVAERLGAALLVVPCVTRDLAAMLEACSGSVDRPPLQAFLDLLRGIGDELNNPLLGASGHLQLAECLLDPERDRDALQSLGAARAALERMATSLARIATLDRARSLRHPLPRVDLRKLLRRTLKSLPEQVRDRVDARRLSEVQVHADRAMLELALRSLLDTAVELAGADLSVRLKLEVEGDRARIRVRLPPSSAEGLRLPHGFSPYHISRVLRGTQRGLDLFLVQTITHAHGGRALASRRRAGDLELTMDLPAEPA